MIYNVDDDDKKQAVFIAKLEILGIYDSLEKWRSKENEDILGQIMAFQVYANKITPRLEY